MTRWYQEKKKEYFYNEAKRKGYRSRSAFKLKQIQNKFKIIKKTDFVLDLGAAPGGWSQVSNEIIGKNGKIIGIDLLNIKPIDGIQFLQEDITEKSTILKIIKIVGENGVDVLLSDMSPNISGNYSIDHANSVHLCKQSLNLVDKILKDNGNFLCKLFMGEEFDDFIKIFKNKFKNVKLYSPPASRKSSSEIYIIGRNFLKK
ncbi:MAG: RlmE family RNA methyltransferase [Candidatus Thermoplasmatota archaeon]|nr:RlmE family RNA methyltransferase [Candidatus Thermoplasmatota archaeon]MCK5300692.1 RlmE family RNA methyltransferase [Thermoplasmatales archaeon]